MIGSIITTLGRPQIYLLIVKVQIMEKFSLKFRGAQIWNKLPKDLKILKSYSQFKNSAKVYVQSYMYSLS